MDQHRLHWALPPCGKGLISAEPNSVATRQETVRRSFTASRESRAQKRVDLEIRLEFLKAHLKSNKSKRI